MKEPHEKTRENQLCPRSCPGFISNDGEGMSTNINVSVLSKLHEKNGSSITDGGHLLHRVQVKHHNVCKTSKIRWKRCSVETSAFSNTTDMGLNRFNGWHSVFVVNEIML